MDKKQLIIIGIIVVIAAIAAVIIFAPSINAHQTSIEVLNRGNIEGNGTIYVKLTDNEKNSLADKKIHVKLVDDKNKVVYDESVETHSTGVAMVKLNNVSSGKYSLNASFDGDENYASSSISRNVTIKGGTNETVDNTTSAQQTSTDSQGPYSSSQSSSGSSYSQSYSSSQSSSGSSYSQGSYSSSQSSSSDQSSSRSSYDNSYQYSQSGGGSSQGYSTNYNQRY